MARILVMGASRGIGLAVVRAALAAGQQVRALARSAAPMAAPGLEWRRGDALNPADVAAALEGLDAVVMALGITPGGLFRPVTLFSAATRVLVPAMEAAGVKRLIAVTGFGTGDSRSAISRWQVLPFRFFLGRAYDDKSEQEAIIRASTLDWTLLRPGVLTNGGISGKAKVLMEPRDWRNGTVSRAEVAAVIIRRALAGELIHQAPVVVR